MSMPLLIRSKRYVKWACYRVVYNKVGQTPIIYDNFPKPLKSELVV